MDRVFDKALHFPGEETKSLRGDVPGQDLADGDHRQGAHLVVSSSVWVCTNKSRFWGIYRIIQSLKEDRKFLEVLFLP